MGYSRWGCEESDMTDTYFHFSSDELREIMTPFASPS